MSAKFTLPVPSGMHACPNCGGFVVDTFTTWGGTCSDICQKIASGNYIATPVGPATLAEVAGWVAVAQQQAKARSDAVEVARRAADAKRVADDAAYQQAWNDAVEKRAQEISAQRAAKGK